MNYNHQSEKRILLIAALLGAVLASAPLGAIASPAFIPGGNQVSVVNNTPGTLFLANASSINGTVRYNLVGSGRNDSFILVAGNASTTFLATGLFNNNFTIFSGGGNSTFSLSSGANSTFIIFEGNVNGSSSTQEFAITGGANCFLNETSLGPVGNALYSVNLGTNSTVSLGSVFAGNQTNINIVF